MVLHINMLANVALWPPVVRKHKPLKPKAAKTAKAFLSTVPLLASMHESDLDKMAARLESVEFKKGDVICKHGEHGSSMFLLEKGDAAVVLEGQQVATKTRGDHFGDQVLVHPETQHLGTLVAETKVGCLVLKRPAFEALREVGAVWEGAEESLEEDHDPDKWDKMEAQEWEKIAKSAGAWQPIIKMQAMVRGKAARRSPPGQAVSKKIVEVKKGRVKVEKQAVERRKAVKAREEHRKVMSEKHKQKAELAREASELRRLRSIYGDDAVEKVKKRYGMVDETLLEVETASPQELMRRQQVEAQKLANPIVALGGAGGSGAVGGAGGGPNADDVENAKNMRGAVTARQEGEKQLRLAVTELDKAAVAAAAGSPAAAAEGTLTVEVATAQAEERAKVLALAQQHEADLMLQIKLKQAADDGKHQKMAKRDRLARNARSRKEGSMSGRGSTMSVAAGSRMSHYSHQPHPPRSGGAGGRRSRAMDRQDTAALKREIQEARQAEQDARRRIEQANRALSGGPAGERGRSTSRARSATRSRVGSAGSRRGSVSARLPEIGGGSHSVGSRAGSPARSRARGGSSGSGVPQLPRVAGAEGVKPVPPGQPREVKGHHVRDGLMNGLVEQQAAHHKPAGGSQAKMEHAAVCKTMAQLLSVLMKTGGGGAFSDQRRQPLYLFKRLDKDNSGFLDKAELTVGLKKISEDGGLKTNSKHVELFCDALDRDGDGQITLNELMNGLLLYKADNARQMLQAASYGIGGQDWIGLFLDYDKAGDGNLHFPEFRKMIRIAAKCGVKVIDEPGLKQLFRLIDTDHSSTINYKEFEAFLQSDMLTVKSSKTGGLPDVLDNALRRIHTAIEQSGSRQSTFFDNLDKDGDGELSLAEFEAAIIELSDDGYETRLTPEEAAAIVALCDLDGDGTVDRGEFFKALKASAADAKAKTEPEPDQATAKMTVTAPASMDPKEFEAIFKTDMAAALGNIGSERVDIEVAESSSDGLPPGVGQGLPAAAAAGAGAGAGADAGGAVADVGAIACGGAGESVAATKDGAALSAQLLQRFQDDRASLAKTIGQLEQQLLSAVSRADQQAVFNKQLSTRVEGLESQIDGLSAQLSAQVSKGAELEEKREKMMKIFEALAV